MIKWINSSLYEHNPDTDPTPENEARKSLLAHAKSRPDSQSLEGKRLVSDREWMLLQEEVSWSFCQIGDFSGEKRLL